MVTSCHEPSICSNSVIITKDGHNGAVLAEAFIRSCGATVADSFHVSIRASVDSPSEHGNILIFVSKHADLSKLVQTGEVRMEWMEGGGLMIEMPELVEIVLQIVRFTGIEIQYRKSG